MFEGSWTAGRLQGRVVVYVPGNEPTLALYHDDLKVKELGPLRGREA